MFPLRETPRTDRVHSRLLQSLMTLRPINHYVGLKEAVYVSKISWESLSQQTGFQESF